MQLYDKRAMQTNMCINRVNPLTSKVTSVVACDNHNPVPLNGNGQSCACKVCHICQDDHHRITNHLV